MESSSINPYHYSYNNPVSFKDPTGLAPEPHEKEDEILSSKEDELQYIDMTSIMAEIIDDLSRYEIQREENFPKSSSLSFILIKYLMSDGSIRKDGYYASSDELQMQVSLAWSGGGSSGGGGGNEAPPEPEEEDDETTTPREGSNDSEIGLTAKTGEEIIGSANLATNGTGNAAEIGADMLSTGNKPGTLCPADNTNSVYMGGAPSTIINNAACIFNICFLHYQFGLHKDLTFDASTLDLNFLSRNHPNLKNLKSGDIRSVNLLELSPFAQATLALGKIKLQYVGNNNFKILPDLYDFNLEKRGGLSIRNIATFFAGLIHGPVVDNKQLPCLPMPSYVLGGSFWIKFTGTIKLKP